MTNPIPINLAVEDALSEAILRQILRESQRDFIDFVNNYWQVEIAALSSPSLKRACDAILTFEPTWQETE